VRDMWARNMIMGREQGLHNRGFVIADFIGDDNEWQRNVKRTKIIGVFSLA
jgi:hypothetical protein